MREREHREGRRAPPAAWAYAVAAVFWLGLPLAFTAYAVPRVWDYVKLLEEQTLDVEAPRQQHLSFRGAVRMRALCARTGRRALNRGVR